MWWAKKGHMRKMVQAEYYQRLVIVVGNYGTLSQKKAVAGAFYYRFIWLAHR